MPASQSSIDRAVAEAQGALGSAFASAAITPPTTAADAHRLLVEAQRQTTHAAEVLTQLEADGALAEHDRAALGTVLGNLATLRGRLPAPDQLVGGDDALDEVSIRDTLIVAQQAASLEHTFVERGRVFLDCMNHGGARQECAVSAVSLVPVPMELAVRIGGRSWLAIGLGIALLGGAAALAVWAASQRLEFLSGLANPRPERITARPSKRFKKRYDLEVEDD